MSPSLPPPSAPDKAKPVRRRIVTAAAGRGTQRAAQDQTRGQNRSPVLGAKGGTIRASRVAAEATAGRGKPSFGEALRRGDILAILLAVPAWIGAACLLAFACGAVQVAGGLVRPLFVLGCLVVSLHAWRQGPARHVQAMLVLFCFAPFARRIVDYYAGFEASGIMLVGPLLALLVPAPRLLSLLDGRSSLLTRGLAPITIVVCCLIYATLLSVLQGSWANAASTAIKWLAPLAYAAVLIETAERRDLVDAITNAFLFILPIVGLYGSFQYVDPPEWDRYWMQFAVAVTAGLPEPYEIRVYSMLNGPASFAAFTSVGILLVTMLRPLPVSIITCAPAALALLLSQYRTAWLSLGLSLLFCLFFPSVRGRAGPIFATIIGGGMVSLTIPGFSDALVERLESFGQGSNDGSLQERLDQFRTLWNQPDSSVIGSGMAPFGDAGIAGAMPIDGMLIACWLMMGLVVGAICISAFVWACGRMMVNAAQSGQRDAIALGALGCGFLLHIPFASLASGELGFLFWIFAAAACLPDRQDPRLNIRGSLTGRAHV